MGTTVHLGKRDVPLTCPDSMSMRRDVLGAYQHNPMRALGAALGACLRPPAAPKTTFALAHHDPLAWGGAVLDELEQAGCTLPQLLEAGQVAFLLIAESMPTAQEVSEAEGFSEAGPANSTGPSLRSSDGGGVSQAG